MSECEVCGKAVSNPRRIDLDGVLLDVCDECMKLGKEIPRERLRTVLKRRIVKEPEFEQKERELRDDFSRMIRDAREERNLKQEEAAQKMGISPSLLRRIEGGFKPDDKTLWKIQRFYNLNLYDK
ncbi:MAG: TIGR00270 family protein [Candidatus Aenigmarchaeota archaeon]|nr:TIGR00270 family protein [Candidatus Aenigmarchaeota archaeon]NIP40748.1 TIGR00270 family protein [Candidatus Aenigmarchaeota archaeon]NIQ18554.1 TIGR00270 family protein [Candidatus Aenigmarchaeota archaeon]NIS73453.1 TIGR00270 family protein [Candidatus Aenigmarchaeota archaeon]